MLTSQGTFRGKDGLGRCGVGGRGVRFVTADVQPAGGHCGGKEASMAFSYHS